MEKLHQNGYIWVIILILMVVALKLFLKWIKKHERTEENTTSDDSIYDLLFKVEYCVVCEENELEILKQIKRMRINLTIDQRKLGLIENKFIRRFAELHLADSFGE